MPDKFLKWLFEKRPGGRPVSWAALSWVAVCLSGAGLLAAGLASAQAAADANRFTLGVCYHAERTALEPSLTLMSQMGVASVRADVYWHRVEQANGQLVMPEVYEKFVDRCVELHIAPLIILGNASPYHDGGKFPKTDEGVQAYRRYAEFVLRTFKGKVHAVEIWNEWNWGTGVPGGGSGGPEDYVRLIKAVVPALRAIDPDLLILGGGTANSAEPVTQPWLHAAFDAGLAHYIDGLSIHPACFSMPLAKRGPWIGVKERLQVINKLLDSRPDCAALSFYITELGWPNQSDTAGTDPATVATFLKDSVVLAQGFPRCRAMWWYDWRDDGTNSKEREDNFGLFTNDLRPKPAVEAFRQAAAKLATQANSGGQTLSR